MNRQQDAGAAMARAWLALEQALVTGDPWRVVTADDLLVFRATFSDRCRRLDHERQVAGNPLTSTRQTWEVHARAVVDQYLEVLAIATGIDPTLLGPQEHARTREQALSAAAELIARRDIVLAGGITERVVERLQWSVGN